MSITNRLSLFFLAALAVVLIGFSSTLYGLASWHLNLQLDRHLESAMQGLIAAVEVHPGDVEWEPLERGGSDASSSHDLSCRAGPGACRLRELWFFRDGRRGNDGNWGIRNERRRRKRRGDHRELVRRSHHGAANSLQSGWV